MFGPLLTTWQFRDEYYRSDHGGRKAALDIRARVKEYLGKAKPELADLPVVIKAFANADGLSQMLVRKGIVRDTSVLWDFARDFSQGCETAEFVLLGSGKGRVDKKIASECHPRSWEVLTSAMRILTMI